MTLTIGTRCALVRYSVAHGCAAWRAYDITTGEQVTSSPDAVMACNLAASIGYIPLLDLTSDDAEVQAAQLPPHSVIARGDALYVRVDTPAHPAAPDRVWRGDGGALLSHDDVQQYLVDGAQLLRVGA